MTYIPWWKRDDDGFDASLPMDDSSNYTEWQLEQIANHLLNLDKKREMCRTCGEYGTETGEIESKLVMADDTEEPAIDENGDVLYVDVPEIKCDNSHRWYGGEGKSRGIDGANPILFENHLQDRRRREIYNSIGTPDPSINKGIYNRSHPQGRKVNTPEQRAKNGASYYS